jgi:adenylate cyclase
MAGDGFFDDRVRSSCAAHCQFTWTLAAVFIFACVGKGDEVVIAWNYQNGKENMQSIKCFFDMKLRIQQKKDKYLQRYGLVPSFKAGIHCGRVIGGEVGVMKRDLTYSGDVLNTTARILSKCGELNEEIIASADVLSGIPSLKDYITKPLGAIKLKGKEKEVMLNALALAA